MLVGEAMAEVGRLLREQRGRAVVTVLGLAGGAFSVIVLLAFGFGLRELLHERAKNMGRGLAVVWPQRTTVSFAGLGRGRPIRLRAVEVLALPAQIPELDAVSPEYIVYERVGQGARVERATLAGVYPAYGDLRSWTIESGGRFLNDIDVAERRRVVVLGNGIREALFGAEPAVGQRVVLRGVPFLVIGTLRPKDQDSDYDGRDERRICLPATTFEAVFGARFLSDFVYRARNTEAHARVTDRIYEALGRAYRFSPDDRLALNVWDTNESERLRDYVFLGFNLMLGGAGVLTLLVGGVGVGNLMFIRVRQRTREIGVQMALGAKPRRILWSVLAESLWLTALGGGLGMGLAWGATQFVARTAWVKDIGEPRLSPGLALLTVLLLGAVGLLAGFFPARRAARLDPVLAMADLPS